MKPLFIFIALAVTFSEIVFAETAFQPPVLKEGLIDKYSNYPASEGSMARTGRVSVSFMVDKDGKPFEVMVEQANNPKFIKATIKSILAGKYEPATLNGVPVEAHIRSVERFNIGYNSRSGSVSTKNMNKYLKLFNAEIKREDPDQKSLSKYLKRMAGTKHGSQQAQRFLSYNRYVYALKFGNIGDQIDAAREVILSANEGGLVRAYPQVRLDLVGLLLNAGRLGEAWIEYSEARRALQGDYRSNLIDSYAEKISQIEQIIGSDKAFARGVQIGHLGYTFVPLVKSSFSFDEIDGKIDTLKLRCKRKFTELAFKAGEAYTIPRAWGFCQLQLLGEQNASANLTQF